MCIITCKWIREDGTVDPDRYPVSYVKYSNQHMDQVMMKEANNGDDSSDIEDKGEA